jgi:hypothetical protein
MGLQHIVESIPDKTLDVNMLAGMKEDAMDSTVEAQKKFYEEN